MNKKEIIEHLSDRVFNIKTNNYIFTQYDDFKVIDQIPEISNVRFYQYDYEIDTNQLVNIKIDMNILPVNMIISYILRYLKTNKIVDDDIDTEIEFKSKIDIMKLQKVLRNNNIVIQIILYNLETITIEEQQLLNELFYFNSPFYCVIAFVKENLNTYFLTDDRVLDYRENYTKIEIKKTDDLKLRKLTIDN